jgi:hypothetical protein
MPEAPPLSSHQPAAVKLSSPADSSAISNAHLAVVPTTFANGWEAMSEPQLLDALQPTAATVDGTRAVLQAQVEELRKRSVSWDAIGGALGISRQAAWERFA